MLRGAIIAPDLNLTELLEGALKEIGGVETVRRLDHYPSSTELPRFLRGSAPQIIFVSVASVQRAAEVAAQIESFASGTQVVAIHGSVDSQLLLEVMRAGIREFISAPFERQTLYETLRRAAELLDKRPPDMAASDQLFAFLPSKPGVGTTTVAVNVSAALARRADMNVLLLDMDLNSGLVGFMLKLDPAYSVVDAAESSSRLDETVWPQLVTSLGRMDVLQSGMLNPGFRIEPSQVRRIIEYARRHYKAICVDLSGNMEQYSIEIMHEATRIFLVCTPEIPSLHLARERINFLRGLELDTRVSVVVNRAQRRGTIPSEEIERLLGHNVLKALPNDYNGVHRALTTGTVVQPTSDLGKAYEHLAKELLEKNTPDGVSKRRFVEYFSILPARYGMVQDSK